ncbi:MAG: helix-turn-helix transcriptional regulator [Clostridium sp.]|uniref:helix-turn-helix transcriptional regulator n=1 Tax=Clostridium sp. TaxID=1506 RepID=UPI003D6D9EF6
MELRNRVKELRARYNLSQGDLGKLVDASRQTISLIERGDYSPSILLALKIAKVLKVTTDELFYLEGGDHNEEI